MNEGQTAARNAFGDRPASIQYDLHGARAVFTDPQVAIAGLTERECKERAALYSAAHFPFDDLGKAIAVGATKGFVKMLAAPDGTILGVAIVGAEAADLIHESIALLYFRANVRDVMSCRTCIRRSQRSSPILRKSCASAWSTKSMPSSNRETAGRPRAKRLPSRSSHALYENPRLYDLAFGFRNIAIECRGLLQLAAFHGVSDPASIADIACGPAQHLRVYARLGL